MTQYSLPSNISLPGLAMPPAPKRHAPGEFDLVPRTVWPTHLFTRKWAEHDREVDGIIAHFMELKARETEQIASRVAVGSKSEDGLFESKMDLFEVSQHPGVQKLHKFLEETIQRVVAGMNGNQVPADRIDVAFRDSWFHITNDGGFHDAHYHGGCSWCGIYYVRAGDVPTSQPKHAGNGINRFYSPISVGGSYDDYGNKYLNNNLIDFPPRDGTVIIFPAYVQHSALAYRGSVDRIVVAFNTTSKVRQA